MFKIFHSHHLCFLLPSVIEKSYGSHRHSIFSMRHCSHTSNIRQYEVARMSLSSQPHTPNHLVPSTLAPTGCLLHFYSLSKLTRTLWRRRSRQKKTVKRFEKKKKKKKNAKEPVVRGCSASSNISSNISPSPLYIPSHRR